MTNKEISTQFSTLAKLMDIHGQNSFKAKSYTNAAFAIGKLPFEIEEVGIEALEGQYGIGKGIINSILEMMDEGELTVLNEMLTKTPIGIVNLLSIKGIGPKKIGQLWRELDIDSPGALLYACNENRLIALKGFGAKTQATIQEKLEFYFSNKGSMMWSQAESMIPSIEKMLESLFPDAQYNILGEYYWHKETVSSFDIVISLHRDELDEALPTEHWVFQDQLDNELTYLFKESLIFKFFCTTEFEFPKQQFIQSFSKELRPEIDFSILDEFKTEEDAFEKLGLDFMPPYLRDNHKALEKAKTKLPTIIQHSDIKGVIHNHTNWSDGVHTIEEMANACIEKGYEYFVLSDHSKTSFYANGLSVERIVAQQAEIDKLNQKLKPFRIFKSIECDILGDGSLDYDDEVLETFDVVICSVHQNLNMTEEKAMARLITAIENPYTSILGHPTGRLLITRKGYPIDHKKIIDACAANDVVIEINANPRRLDIDWRWIDYALENDVMLSINPDAHRIEGIDDIRYGVNVAQKGMLPAAMNLSSFSLSEFEEFLMHQHSKRR